MNDNQENAIRTIVRNELRPDKWTIFKKRRVMGTTKDVEKKITMHLIEFMEWGIVVANYGKDYEKILKLKI